MYEASGFGNQLMVLPHCIGDIKQRLRESLVPGSLFGIYLLQREQPDYRKSFLFFIDTPTLYLYITYTIQICTSDLFESHSVQLNGCRH